MGQLLCCYKDVDDDTEYLTKCYKYTKESEIILCHQCLSYRKLYCSVITNNNIMLGFCSKKCYKKYLVV